MSSSRSRSRISFGHRGPSFRCTLDETSVLPSADRNASDKPHDVELTPTMRRRAVDKTSSMSQGGVEPERATTLRSSSPNQASLESCRHPDRCLRTSVRPRPRCPPRSDECFVQCSLRMPSPRVYGGHDGVAAAVDNCVTSAQAGPLLARRSGVGAPQRWAGVLTRRTSGVRDPQRPQPSAKRCATGWDHASNWITGEDARRTSRARFGRGRPSGVDAGREQTSTRTRSSRQLSRSVCRARKDLLRSTSFSEVSARTFVGG